MKFRFKFVAILVIMLGVFAISRCGDDSGSGDTVVTFTDVIQVGGVSGTTTTTDLTLTFSVDPTTLTANDINVIGATKGALSGSGTTRILEISDITVANESTVTVTVTSPVGYAITGSPQTVVVYKVLMDVTFTGVTQLGGESEITTTTSLTLTFSEDPITLLADNISITGATKGALSGSGTTRILEISDITVANSATVSVSITSPPDYVISGSPHTVVVYKALTVTYHANGGTGGAVPTDITQYSNGQQVTVLDNTGSLVGTIIRDGIKQRFIGWSTDPQALIVQYVVGNTFDITENTTLYAIYTTGNDVLRKVGQAGGWVFYDAGSIQSWGRYLEVWISNESGTHQWKQSRTFTSGTLTAIGTGYTNTYDRMINSDNYHYPAEIITHATHGGYSDWFLPSKDELYEMCWVLHSRRRYNNGSSWVIEDNPVYGTNRVGGFTDSRYWSSSEFSVTSANFQTFSTGQQGSLFKDLKCFIRAVRAF